MPETISVIIPIYNIEQYLKRCIDSILSQSYKDLEVILVDDGSTDKSGEICDEYAKADSRVKVIHQKNSGVSVARNNGISVATGEYIGFVDGDDYIDEKMYETLMLNALNNDADISSCNIETYNIGEQIEKTKSQHSVSVFSTEDIIRGFFVQGKIKDFIVSPCNKIIKRSLISSTRFKKYALGEDFLFAFELLGDCKIICNDEYVGYYYCHRDGSAMTSKFSKKRFDYIYAIEEIEKICEKQYPYVVEQCRQWVFCHKLITYRALIINKLTEQFEKESKNLKIFLLENKKIYFKSLPTKRKIDFILSLYCPTAYKIIKRG